ncbi:hypothetical protein VTO73DRAFT_2011 [Trametes versicolor]
MTLARWGPPIAWFWTWTFTATVWSVRPTTAANFSPASIPLAVRSPYMSVWYNNTNGSLPLSESLPIFWGLQETVGWVGRIRVDGRTYSWMGQDGSAPLSATVTDMQITPTRSIFTMHAGLMNLTITFLSPIEPSDWVLQSLPFSYVSVDASSLDGQSHDVQLYSDITSDWATGDRVRDVQWSQHATAGSIYHQVSLIDLQPGEENNQQAQDGVAYYGMANRQGLTWTVDNSLIARAQFRNLGKLANNASTTYGPMQQASPALAIAVDLGQIQSTSTSVTWTVGFVRDPSIVYAAPNGATEQLRPYFVTRYGSDIGRAIDDLTSGYADTLQRAVALEKSIIADASNVSTEYSDLVSLATRQPFGSIDITVSSDADGNPNATDVRIFMKDIGGLSATQPVTQRVSAPERIYAAMPMFLYFNASFLGPLIAPLLDAQDSLTGMLYAAQDLGVAYPKASGTHGAHLMGIEESGNMLIMAYAHARLTGDGSLIHNHYNLTKRWADYLVANTLIPDNQDAADESGANQTNLALKGVIGIKTMAEISRALGEQDDAQQYDVHAAALMDGWQALSLSTNTTPYAHAEYHDGDSWALLYNGYADRLLGTGILSQSLLQNQTAWYKSLISAALPYGVAIDSEVQNFVSAAWLLFTAATATDNDARDGLIHGVWARAGMNLVDGPFPEQYDAWSGMVLQDSGGPAVGAIFSLLALNVPSKTISLSSIQATPASNTSTPGSPPASVGPDGGNSQRHTVATGAIAGGVVGGLAFLGLAVLGALLLRRRQQRSRIPGGDDGPTMSEDPHQPTPFTLVRRPLLMNIADRSSDMGSSTKSLTPIVHITSPAGPSSQEPSVMVDSPMTLKHSLITSGTGNIAASSGQSPGGATSPGTERLSPAASSPRTGIATRASGEMVLLPRSDVLGMQAEMEVLREEMRQIIEERQEPPPEYTSTFGS